MMLRLRLRIPIRGGGGGTARDYPPGIWTTPGGAYVEVPNAKRNIILVGGLMTLAAAYIFRVSARNERRYRPGWRPVPSQRWAKHTLEDDPDYYERRRQYHANKPSLWSRIGPDPEH